MIPFRSLRSHPYFAPLFAEVHPLCWPILWWSLNHFLKWCRTADYDVMFSTTWWGSIRIVYFGDKKVDPSAYRPYILTKPRFDDPVWQSAVPVMLRTLSFEAVRPDATFILPLLRGRCSEGAEGAFPLPDTS